MRALTEEMADQMVAEGKLYVLLQAEEPTPYSSDVYRWTRVTDVAIKDNGGVESVTTAKGEHRLSCQQIREAVLTRAEAARMVSQAVAAQKKRDGELEESIRRKVYEQALHAALESVRHTDPDLAGVLRMVLKLENRRIAERRISGV